MSLALSISVVPLLARWAVAAPSRSRAGRSAEAGSHAGVRRALRAMVARPARRGHRRRRCSPAPPSGCSITIGTGFLPPADEGGFVVDYLTPAGSALEETDRQVRAMEKVIAETPEVAAYSRRTGSELGLFATAQNTGDILVRLKPRADRDRSAEEIISDLRPKLQEAAPLAEIEFVQLLQDMLGDLEGSADADRGQDLRRRSGGARDAGRAGRGDARRRSTASSTSSACSAGIPRSPGRSIRSRPDASV